MQPAAEDVTFVLSAGGKLFPRSNVAAGTLWNYDSALEPSSDEFQARTGQLAHSQISRGLKWVCPPCSSGCGFGGRCGTAYHKHMDAEELFSKARSLKNDDGNAFGATPFTSPIKLSQKRDDLAQRQPPLATVAAQLSSLFELHQAGGLTAAEFTSAKAAVLQTQSRGRAAAAATAEAAGDPRSKPAPNISAVCRWSQSAGPRATSCSPRSGGAS
jgi:hypothetical protein